jgi:hypothetical protein
LDLAQAGHRPERLEDALAGAEGEEVRLAQRAMTERGEDAVFQRGRALAAKALGAVIGKVSRSAGAPMHRNPWGVVAEV